MKNQYFIKKGYVPNKELKTLDSISNEVYWNESRLRKSSLYQYYVYKYACFIAKKNKLKKIIDVGCGSGMKLNLLNKSLSDIEIIGIDQQSAVDFCIKNHSFGEFYEDDFENPKQLGLNADLIICADVIEHLLRPELLLNYIKGNLKKEGFLILSTPERDLLYDNTTNNTPRNKYHIREWNKNELASFVESEGFEILEHKMQYSIKLGNNRLLKTEVLPRIKERKPLKYNQVILAKLS